MSGPPSRPRKWPVRAAAVGLCLCTGLTVLTGLFWMIVDPDEEYLALATGIAALLMLLSGAWLVAVLVLRRGRFRLLMVMGMTGVFAGMMLVIWSLLLEYFGRWQTARVMNQFGLTVLLPTLALIHNGGMSLLRARSALMVIKISTMICAWLFVAGILIVNWLEPSPLRPWFTLLMTILILTGVAALGTIAGTVIVPVVVISRADRAVRPVESLDRRLSIDMACPKCGHRQAFVVGNARCPACRARLFIEIEEPRCECGYLLYRLEGEACPECGRTIPPEMRWQGASAAAGDPAASG